MDRRRPDDPSRRAELAAFADRMGLTFESEAPQDLLDARFFLASLNSGEPMGIAWNLIAGPDGHPSITYVDYTIRPLPSIRTGTRTDINAPHILTFSVSVESLARSVPYICVQRKDWLTRIADGLDRIDHLHHDRLEVVFGVPAFDRHFEVRTPDPDSAVELFDGGFMKAMLEHAGDFAVELAGDRFIVYSPLLLPRDLPRLFDATVAIRAALPPGVSEK